MPNKTGRPSLGRSHAITLRVPLTLKVKLLESAGANDRSLTGEVMVRIERTFCEDARTALVRELVEEKQGGTRDPALIKSLSLSAEAMEKCAILERPNLGRINDRELVSDKMKSRNE